MIKIKNYINKIRNFIFFKNAILNFWIIQTEKTSQLVPNLVPRLLITKLKVKMGSFGYISFILGYVIILKKK